MKIETDTLKYAKLLNNNGFSREQAEGLVTTVSNIDINNIYDKQEVTDMINDRFEQICDRMDKRIESRREESEQWWREFRKENRQEWARSRRWVIGTTLAVGGYLSALIHFTH